MIGPGPDRISRGRRSTRLATAQASQQANGKSRITQIIMLTAVHPPG
jgi:hypothetical protein